MPDPLPTNSFHELQPQQPPLIVLQDVRVAFAQEDAVTLVLDAVSLQIHRGEYVALVGPNGSGKSTLGQVMAGLCEVSSGSAIRPQWTPLPGVNGRGGGVAVIFQNPDAQIVEQTVLADVCFGMENLAVPRLEMAYRAERALAACGLSKLTHAQVGELSGGQKQLLCIAGALAMSPQVLILDEATSMLPPATRQQILQVVQQQHQSGMTLVWITQWMEEAAQAQRVIALNQGRVAFDGTPEEFFHPTLVVNSAQPGHGGGESSETKKTSSVCENLGFPLPYTLEVTKALADRGIRWQNWPLTPAALTRELSQL